MAENGNNPSQSQFSSREIEIIDQIITTLAIVLDNCIRDLRDPKQIMKKYSGTTSSKTKITRAFTALVLQNADNEKGVYPSQLKREKLKFLQDYIKNPKRIFLLIHLT